jgi:alpha-ribazole phosphatase
MSEIRWWWMRHAPSRVPSGVIAGKSDVACDLPPVVHLQSLLPPQALWLVSPLKRAVDTAEALSGKRDFRREPAFVEQDFGQWEGKSWSDPAIDPAFWDDPAQTRPPGGESFAEVAIRVAVAIQRINQGTTTGDIVVVAHAGPIRAALALALDMTPEQALRFALDPLSLTRLDYFAQGWRIGGVNLPLLSRLPNGK